MYSVSIFSLPDYSRGQIWGRGLYLISLPNIMLSSVSSSLKNFWHSHLNPPGQPVSGLSSFSKWSSPLMSQTASASKPNFKVTSTNSSICSLLTTCQALQKALGFRDQWKQKWTLLPQGLHSRKGTLAISNISTTITDWHCKGQGMWFYIAPNNRMDSEA